jgi:hypothetical protein
MSDLCGHSYIKMFAMLLPNFEKRVFNLRATKPITNARITITRIEFSINDITLIISMQTFHIISSHQYIRWPVWKNDAYHHLASVPGS